MTGPVALAAALLAAAGTIACAETPSSGAAPAAQASPATPASLVDSPHLQITGRSFRTSDDTPWAWRGITAFRLLEQLAAGHADEVERYLGWASEEHLTVVRVLAMAKHLFELPPERGRAHLDDLLRRAARHGLHVEIVALADTASFDVAPDAQVRAIAEIASRHGNALLELANEPNHPTQREEVRRRDSLARWLSLVPHVVPVATGAHDSIEESSDGDYVTFHFPRSSAQDGWGHIVALAEGAAGEHRAGKPLINDEPIGAGPVFQPGRRDDSADRMRAAALLTRMTGMGATFHYEGGLHAAIPSGPELAAFKAWQEAWEHLPPDVEEHWTFRVAGGEGAATRRVTGAAGAWEIQRDSDTWLLIVGARAPGVQWAPGWREDQVITWSDSQLRRALRTGS